MSQPVLLDEFNTRNTFHGTNRFKLHCRESDSVQPWFLFSSAVEINRISARVSNLKWNLVIKLWTCSHLNDHLRWSKRNGLDEKVFTGLLSAATRATYGVIDLIILMLDTQTSLCLLQQYGRENFCTRTHLPVVVFNYFFSCLFFCLMGSPLASGHMPIDDIGPLVPRDQNEPTRTHHVTLWTNGCQEKSPVQQMASCCRRCRSWTTAGLCWRFVDWLEISLFTRTFPGKGSRKSGLRYRKFRFLPIQTIVTSFYGADDGPETRSVAQSLFSF